MAGASAAASTASSSVKRGKWLHLKKSAVPSPQPVVNKQEVQKKKEESSSSSSSSEEDDDDEADNDNHNEQEEEEDEGSNDEKKTSKPSLKRQKTNVSAQKPKKK